MLTPAQRADTLKRFDQHRRAWAENPTLQILYGEWYGRIRRHLPPPVDGPWWELGSGPGFARRFIPELSLSDLVAAPWHDREIAADALPFADGSVGALVLFDVLHHLPSSARFFAEATRVLRTGGRVVLCEPGISPLSFPVYKFLHEEPLRLFVDPFVMGTVTEGADKDPFDSNQAIPSLMFGRPGGRRRFRHMFPTLEIRTVERLAGLSYPASGGFSRGPLLPAPLWRRLFAVERFLPQWIFSLIGFRLLIVLEKQ
ncbi:MAG TPA: class I SAM-dependent methyltransferase [Polyangia bacterium]|jgi:SAM-dependent methyltransferase|nr:class I SAM-dependent methyltransferase [Polyangia bacterium]